MDPYEELKAAIVEQLVYLKALPEDPISLLHVGPTLVAKGYTLDEVVKALFSLERGGVIELMTGNRVRLRERRKVQPKLSLGAREGEFRRILQTEAVLSVHNETQRG